MTAVELLEQQKRWLVRAVVVGSKHVDALTIGSISGPDLDAVGELVCDLLPTGDSPFGDFYLVATSTDTSSATEQFGGFALFSDVLICPVRRSLPKRAWRAGSWVPATSDHRFARYSSAVQGQE